MSRFATLAALLSATLAAAAPLHAEGLPPALPDWLADARIRPSIIAEEAIVEASLAVDDPRDAAPAGQPSLADRMAMAPRLIVTVDIGDQTMAVRVDGEVVHRWTVSTGAKGYETPTGVWQPYRMHTMWRSRKYDDAPMPHSIFFTGGYAIHATPHLRRLGRPASHGCVRLHPDHAKALFALTLEHGRARTRVVIQD